MSSQGSANQAFTDFKHNASAHGLLAGISFMVVLPTGILIARYMRTFNNRLAPSLTLHPMTSCEGAIADS